MLTCQNLTYVYDDDTVGASSLNFTTENGNIIGIIGANGAGKSTFFKCLLGLLKPQEGTVNHQGNPVKYDKKNLRQLRQSVNLVLQDPERQLFFSKAYDDVAMGPRNLGYDEATVDTMTMTAINQVGGQDYLNKPLQYLSFGQKKRVAIAGVLALNCDILLMDEPETGLDPQMRRDMIELIQTLASQGKKIILSSHNMDMIYEICDYVYLMHQGTFIAEGKPFDIMSQDSLMQKTRLEKPTIIKMSQHLNIPIETLESALFKL